jgi:hypothetical protein
MNVGRDLVRVNGRGCFMPVCEIASRGAPKSQFAFAISQQYYGGLLYASRESANLRNAMV